MLNYNKIKKVKYLHILWHPDLKFNPIFVKMINQEDDFFKREEHLFVTPHKNVYEALSEYENVVLSGRTDENLINKFGRYGEWIFVHALNCSKLKIIFTCNKYARKVIWRTWGHDIRPMQCGSERWLESCMKKKIWELYCKKIERFEAIGIGKEIDRVNIKKYFGDIRTCLINYSYRPEREEKLNRIKMQMYEAKSGSAKRNIRILIGHSGSDVDRHFEAMKVLEKYKEKDITICLILSYGGDKEYMEAVKKQAIATFGNKIEIVEEFMEYYEYVKYLSSIDIILYNQIYSAALANLSILLFLDKMIYFNKNGQFKECFEREQCSYRTVDEIEKMDYEEFISNKMDEKLKELYGSLAGSKMICERFRNVLDDLCSK